MSHIARVKEMRGVYKMLIQRPDSNITWEIQAYRRISSNRT
jgi:hypothetical protein